MSTELVKEDLPKQKGKYSESINNLFITTDCKTLIASFNSGYIKNEYLNKIQKSKYFKSVSLLSGSIGKIACHSSSEFLFFSGGQNNSFRPSNVLVAWNSSTNEEQNTLDIKEEILNILIEFENGELHIIIVIKNKIKIYNARFELLYSLKTFDNPQGLCDVKKNKQGILTILTLGSEVGDVCIFWPTLKTKCEYNIKKNIEIDLLKLNNDSSLFAVVTKKSSKIYIHNSENGSLIKILKRGNDFTKKIIYSVSFSENSKLLACISNSGTLHIFDLKKDKNKKGNIFSSLFSASLETSIKKIKIFSNEKSICAFDSSSMIHILSVDGCYQTISGEDYSYSEKINILEKTKNDYVYSDDE